MEQKIFTLLIWFTVFYEINATISRSDREFGKNKLKNKKNKNAGSYNIPPYCKDKLKADAKSILKLHDKVSVEHADVKNFPGVSLAYVTPWNSHGYNIAKTFSNKFTFVAPVWLQIKRLAVGNQFDMLGTHDIDKGWVNEVKKNKKTAITPRVLFENWSYNDWLQTFQSKEASRKCALFLTNFAKSHNFDGFVLEFWSQIANYMRKEALPFIKSIGEVFRKQKVTLIVVLPPPNVMGENSLVTGEEIVFIAKHVDYISLMTYDYSNPTRAGPNSPLFWLESIINFVSYNLRDDERSKILMGLNFYGLEFELPSHGAPIIGSQYLQVLKDYKPKLVWEESSHEHHLKFTTITTEQHIVYYPTVKSILERLQFAAQRGLGISIWEIGQGLDYFYDLL